MKILKFLTALVVIVLGAIVRAVTTIGEVVVALDRARKAMTFWLNVVRRVIRQHLQMVFRSTRTAAARLPLALNDTERREIGAIGAGIRSAIRSFFNMIGIGRGRYEYDLVRQHRLDLA